jgi:hypothetical protein
MGDRFIRGVCVALGSTALLVLGCGSTRGKCNVPTAGQDEREQQLAEAELLRTTNASNQTVAWSHYTILGFCKAASVNQAFVVMTSEDEYRRHFCSQSSIDWTRFRLAVYSEVGVATNVGIEDVARDEASYVVVLRRRLDCGGPDVPYEAAFNLAAVLIPAGAEPVRRFHAPPLPCIKSAP